MGRFLTADPYRASGGPSNPQSWNRYAYVSGDPINYVDPAGLEGIPVSDPSPVPFGPKEPVLDERRLPHPTMDFQDCPQDVGKPELTEEEWQESFDSVEMDATEMVDLLAGAGGKTEYNPALPAFAAAAASAANWVVYYARTPQGQYYIGVTNNFAARQAQHAQRFAIQLVQGLPKMNYATAKGMEQTFIESVRSRHGNQALLNKINSISPNSNYYNRFKSYANDVMNKCGDAFRAASPF